MKQAALAAAALAASRSRPLAARGRQLRPERRHVEPPRGAADRGGSDAPTTRTCTRSAARTSRTRVTIVANVDPR